MDLRISCVGNSKSTVFIRTIGTGNILCFGEFCFLYFDSSFSSNKVGWAENDQY